MIRVRRTGRAIAARVLLATTGLFSFMTVAQAQRESILESGGLAPMLEKVLPAVVSIRVRGFEAVEQNPLFNHPLFGQMVNEQMTEPAQREFQASGSGVVVDATRGLIITNFHVIERAKQIKVQFQDGRQFVGRLLGRDAATDVAAVQIDATGLVAVPLGDSHKVRVGDFVVAVGNPFGLDATSTFGMVSSTKRTTVRFRKFESYIQHDAAVNSGNSGGALVNLEGELVGINTAILSPSGGNIGLAFAIPIDMAMQVLEQLVQYGRVRRGGTGIRPVDLSQAKIQELDLAVFKGALIAGVQKGSPAEAAGALPNDLIVGVTLPSGVKQPVRGAGELIASEAILEIGQKVVFEVVRGGRTMDLPVEIADLKREPEKLEVPAGIVRMAGVVVASLEADSPLFGEVNGVEVIEVKAGTLAQLVGLLPGDVITSVEQETIRRPDDLVRAIRDRNAKFEMKVLRSGVPVVVKFPL